MQFAVMRLATLDFQIREVPTEIPRNVFKSNADYPETRRPLNFSSTNLVIARLAISLSLGTFLFHVCLVDLMQQCRVLKYTLVFS